MRQKFVAGGVDQVVGRGGVVADQDQDQDQGQAESHPRAESQALLRSKQPAVTERQEAASLK